MDAAVPGCQKAANRVTGEGFQYRINNDVTDNKTSLEKSLNGWNWQKIADLDYRVAGNELVVAVPAQAIGIANANDFAIDFKWIDNAVERRRYPGMSLGRRRRAERTLPLPLPI